MGSSRLRVGLVVAAAATMVLGVLAVPGAAQAVTAKPTGLSPNDPNSAPTSPVSGTPIKNVVLSWSTVTGAIAYQVQVSDKNGNFDTPSIDVSTTTTRYAPSAKLYHADYAWRVRASGGTWSDLAYFTRGWTASAASPQVIPNGANTGPVLTWGGLADASFYEVQFSPRPFVQGTNPVDAGDGGESGADIKPCFTASNVFTPYQATSGDDAGIFEGTTVKCTELVGGPFYWRVRGRDGVFDPATIDLKAPSLDCAGVYYGKTPANSDVTNADCSAWSYPAVPSFNVQTHVSGSTPAQVTGLDVSPRDGDGLTDPVLVTSTPVFSWTPVANASFYRVYQVRDGSAQSWDHVWETTAPKLAPVIQEEDANVRTSWRVEACSVTATDTDGFILNYKGDDTIGIHCGLASAPRMYRKQTPHVAQPLAVSTVPGGHTFTWNTAIDFSTPDGLAVRVADVKGYELQLSDNYGSFESPARTIPVDRQGTTAGQTSATVADAGLPAGYKWRVRGVDSSGHDLPWSEPAVDVVGTLAAAHAHLTTTSLPALRTPINFTFDAPVDGVVTGTARIIADSDSAAFPGVVSPVNDTTYRFTPSSNWVAGERYRLLLTAAVKTAATDVAAVSDFKTIRAYTMVDSASGALTKVAGDAGWTTAKASDAQSGTYLRSDDRRTTTKRSYVQTRLRGSKVTVYGCYGPSSGNAGVYIDGSLKATVNLYRSYSKCGVVYTYALNPLMPHNVRFAPLGTKVKAAKSTLVRFDAFRVS